MFVAAVDHIHPATDAAVAPCRGDVFEDVVFFSGHDLLTAVHLAEQCFEPIRMLGAHDQVQFGHTAQQRFTLLLGDAASHHQGEIGIGAFPLGLTAEVAVNLLLSVVSDCAGVVEDQVGVQLGFGFPIAHRFEDAGHPLGICLVHLAAERCDPVAAPTAVCGGFS